MRFLAALWIGVLESGAWLRNAAHGNAAAALLASRVDGLAGIEFAFPIEANAVFLCAPERVIEGLLARGWRFYTFFGGAACFMFAWEADLAIVEQLADDIPHWRRWRRRPRNDGSDQRIESNQIAGEFAG
jgi:threonine aldolase